jgi:L-asparaginase
VIEAFGGGHLPSTMVPVVRDLSHRIPVVLASRTGAGAVLTRTYAFAGSEIDLLKAGAIHAGSLHPLKARLLLAMLIAAGSDRKAIRGEFRTRAELED